MTITHRRPIAVFPSADTGRTPPTRRREDLRLVSGIFDEQVLGGAEQVVVDLDAIDEKNVVVGKRADTVT